MTVWPLFLLSMRALNSHAGPLLDEYEVVEVDLPELPQPELHTDLADILLPFRKKREAERQYSQAPRDIRYGRGLCTLQSPLLRSDQTIRGQGGDSPSDIHIVLYLIQTLCKERIYLGILCISERVLIASI